MGEENGEVAEVGEEKGEVGEEGMRAGLYNMSSIDKIPYSQLIL